MDEYRLSADRTAVETVNADDEAVALRLAAISVDESVSLRLAALAGDMAPTSTSDARDAIALRLTALQEAANAAPFTEREHAGIGAFVERSTVVVSRTERAWRIADASQQILAPTPVHVTTPSAAPEPFVATAPIAAESRPAPARRTGRGRGRLVVRSLAAAIVVVSALAAPTAQPAWQPEPLRVASIEATLAPAPFPLPPLASYRAEFESESPFPTVAPGGEVEWVVALRNTGSVGWYRGVDGAQASLKLSDGTLAAVQSTPFVAPGQVGWFVTRFVAPSTPSTHKVALLPTIDGQGPLPDLGLYAVVTVTR